MSLWVYDEMRYGLPPLLRKMWSLIRTRVATPVFRTQVPLHRWLRHQHDSKKQNTALAS